MSQRKIKSTLLVGLLLLLSPTMGWSIIDAPAGTQAEGAIDDGNPRVVSTLLTDHNTVKAGQNIRAGIFLEMDDHWHVYWKNSGEAGLPTQVTWRIRTDEGQWKTITPKMAWPAPLRFVESSAKIITYGYDHNVLHNHQITIPDDAQGQITLEARVNFLTCAKICLPGDVTVTKTLQIGEQTPSAQANLFDAWHIKVPTKADVHGLEVTHQDAPIYPGARPLVAFSIKCKSTKQCATLSLDAQENTGAFIPNTSKGTTWTTKRVTKIDDAFVVELEGKTKQNLSHQEEDVGGVLRLKDEAGKGHFVNVSAKFKVLKKAPTTPLSKQTATDLSASKDKTPSAPISIWYALILAFFGGLLLNGMPCVFPVLTLKISAMAHMATQSRRAMVAQALAYTAGIVVSMVALAIVITGLKAAGTQVGWGFQFQNPWYLTAQCALLTLFAVNLFGGFEVLLPVNINVGSKFKEDGLGRSFFEGLLCVLLATPCTAPMMGTAMGFALSSSTIYIFVIFIALGLGLASPFLVLVAFPGWRKMMPKPGGWLERLKHVMGFSLLATCIWLTWVVGSTFGATGMLKLLLFLLILSFASWMFGVVQFTPGRRKVIITSFALLITVAGGWGLLDFATPKNDTKQTKNDGWTKFDEAVIQQALAKKQPVFVDFTADWCISCKVNEGTVLSSNRVQAAVKKHNVLMMKADWTRKDERIRKILMRHGKAGVPMYLVYSPQNPNTPQVLPEVLTPDLVIKSLAQAAATP